MYEGLTGHEPHPVVGMPTGEQLSRLSLEDQELLWKQRAQVLKAMEVDPLRYGYEPTSWARADAALRDFREQYPVGVLIFLVLGGHRASKTEWRSKRSVQNLFRNPNYKIWACQSTQEASREAQQIPIYKYLPCEYKVESGKMRFGKRLKVNYTPWAGFTEDVFAVQNLAGNTSECRFKFYSMNPKSLEGAEINEGWADEEATLEWLEALIYRLVSRNGILYMTFTPRWGYTQTVKTILQGAVTIEEGETDVDLIAVRDAKGNVIAAKKVPLVQENNAIEIPGHKVKGRIVYFHTCENPFPLGNWANMKETLKGASEEKILTVAYGVPTRSLMAQFPMFKDLTHIISLNRFREIQKGGGVWYHFLDPCSARNWFQMWIFIDILGRAFVVGETPSHGHRWAYIPGVGDPGPWAVAGNKADGEQGEGQKEWGWGYDRYLEEIDRMERILNLESGGGQIHPDSPAEIHPALERSSAVPTRHAAMDGPPPQNLGSSLIDKNDRNLTANAAYGDAGNSSAPPAQKIRVEARWIDARYGSAKRTTEERSTNLIEDLEQKGMVFLACPAEKFLYDQAKGGESIRMINNRLYFDATREMDYLNQPKLYVVETCPNTIFALKEWSGKDGQHGACKDPIDTLRMFVLSGSEYVPESLLQPRTPWMAQFSR